MKATTAFLFAMLAAGACLPAQAQDKKQATQGYKQMCMQAASMPKPYGEYDLKGNSKLDAYCGCFSEQFMEHVMKVDPNGKAPTADEAIKRDLAMRNSCRQKLGLPLAK